MKTISFSQSLTDARLMSDAITAHSTELATVGLPDDTAANLTALIADMNTPLAMLIAGATAAQSDLLRSVFDKNIMLTALYKLLLLPICVMAVMHFLPHSQSLIPEIGRAHV